MLDQTQESQLSYVILFMISSLRTIQALTNTRTQVLVLGGGCNGAGCLLDLALRGIHAVLIDKHDFSEGTSSKSSKILHGGIRYLQEVFALSRASLSQRAEKLKLVSEALGQRQIVCRMAPRLAHPMNFIIPCRDRLSSLYFFSGTSLYSWISKLHPQSSGQFQHPRILSRQSLAAAYSGMREEFKYGVQYTDGFFNDARLNIDMILKAQDISPKISAHNYVQFRKPLFQNGRIRAALLFDRTRQSQITVQCDAIINCTGPFTDPVRKTVNPNLKPCVVPVAGTHLIYSNSDFGSPKYALCVPSSDGRVFFSIPFLDAQLVGTTQNKLESSVIDPQPTARQIEQLISQLKGIVTNQSVNRPSCSITGIRPLILDQQAKDTKSLARTHKIQMNQSGMISILGGKWTSYRLVAQQAVDKCLQWMSHRGLANQLNQSRTKFFCLGPKEIRVNNSEMRQNLRHFGYRAERVAALEKGPEVAAGLTRNQILYLRDYQGARRAEDVLFRRTRLGLTQAQGLSQKITAIEHVIQGN